MIVIITGSIQCIFIITHVYVYIYTYTCVFIYIYTLYVYVYIYIDMKSYVHIHITYIYIYLYMTTCMMYVPGTGTAGAGNMIASEKFDTMCFSKGLVEATGPFHGGSEGVSSEFPWAPIDRWMVFVRDKPMWMMTGGTPMTMETTSFLYVFCEFVVVYPEDH